MHRRRPAAARAGKTKNRPVRAMGSVDTDRKMRHNGGDEDVRMSCPRMSRVTVYTAPNCIDCAAVKNLLERADVSFREVDISREPHAREALAMLSGLRSVPQVFVGAQYVGQVAEIRYMVQTGTIERLRTDT